MTVLIINKPLIAETTEKIQISQRLGVPLLGSLSEPPDRLLSILTDAVSTKICQTYIELCIPISLLSASSLIAMKTSQLVGSMGADLLSCLMSFSHTLQPLS